MSTAAGDGRIPFIGDESGETAAGSTPTSAEADALASGVDPRELGLDEEATPEVADADPEATP